ncbi:MAG: histidine kinase [Aeromicrobium sp.]
MSNERPPAASWMPHRWDMAAGLLAAVLGVWVLHGAGTGTGYRPADATGYALTAVGGASLAWGRQHPLASTIVASVATAAVGIMDLHVDVLPFVVAVLLFQSGSHLTAQRAAIALSTVAAALGTTVTFGAADLGRPALLQSSAIFVTVWVLGRMTRSRRSTLLALVDASKRQADAERRHAELVQIEQRLQIARELHDVLAHSISVISVQATVGEHLSRTDATAARSSLHTIGELSRSSMREIRQMLDLLRDGADSSSPYAPAPGLADLDDLLSTYRTAGLPVLVTTTGTSRPVSASAGLCAYRIIQEALTNTLRHADARSAQVRLDYGSTQWEIFVTDDGPSPSPPADQVDSVGHGLAGMRERTALLGGRLRAGPGPSGGYQVHATIPYEAG